MNLGGWASLGWAGAKVSFFGEWGWAGQLGWAGLGQGLGWALSAGWAGPGWGWAGGCWRGLELIFSYTLSESSKMQLEAKFIQLLFSQFLRGLGFEV